MQRFLQEQSLGKRIIIGIIIFASITLILKMIAYKSPKTTGDQLREMASEANKTTPLTIDSLTVLDSVTVPDDFILVYNYKLNALAENIDTNALKSFSKTWVLDKMKNDPNAKFLKENMIELHSRYFDKNGVFLCLISVTPYEYLTK